MKQRAAVALFSVVSLILLTASTADAVVARLGGTLTALGALSRGSAVAFGNNVYLVVSSYGTVRGQLHAADGSAIGAMFVIQATANYTHFPRVGFSPDANGGQGAFLVTWHESDLAGGATSVHARLVSLGGALVSADTRIGTDGSWWEAGPAVAYASVSQEFLVVWQRGLGSVTDISAARVSNSGALLGNIAITSTAACERDPSVAYNPTTDEFLVVYAGSCAQPFVNAQRVKAGTGALLGGAITLHYVLGPYITDVSYNSSTNQFLAAWHVEPIGIYGRVIGADGSLPGLITPLSIRFRSTDALSLAFNTRSGTFLLTSHDTMSYDAGGVQITAAGLPEDSGGLLTAAGDAPNYYPRLAASTAQPEWMVVASHAWGFTLGQRLGSSSSTTTPPPPPPSPPPPAKSLPLADPTSASAANNGRQQLFFQSDDGSLARWGLADNVAQEMIFLSPANVDPNWRIVGTGDVDRDGQQDIFWRHRQTGGLAVWTMNGSTLRSAAMLNPAYLDLRWRVVSTKDVNSDGYPDLLLQHESGALAVWYLAGVTLIDGEMLTSGVSDTNWQVIGMGDANRDGWPDLFWQHQNGTLALWYMRGSQLIDGMVILQADANWRVRAVLDLNGDRWPDLVWQHSGGNWLAATLLDGANVMDSVWMNPDTITMGWQIMGPK